MYVFQEKRRHCTDIQISLSVCLYVLLFLFFSVYFSVEVQKQDLPPSASLRNGLHTCVSLYVYIFICLSISPWALRTEEEAGPRDFPLKCPAALPFQKKSSGSGGRKEENAKCPGQGNGKRAFLHFSFRAGTGEDQKLKGNGLPASLKKRGSFSQRGKESLCLCVCTLSYLYTSICML